MPISEIYDQATPTGALDPRQLDEQMTLKWRAIGERMRAGGHVWETGSPIDAQAGRHACGTDPDGDANQFIIYEDDETTAALTLDTDDGGNKRGSLGDGVGGSNPWYFRADTLEGYRDSTVTIPIPASSVGRVPGLSYQNRGGGTITLLEVDAWCSTAPTGADWQLDMHLLDNTWTAPDATGTPPDQGTIASGGTPPVITIADGAKRAAAPITSFGDTDLEVGEMWVFEIDQVGSTAAGDGFVVSLKIRRKNF